MTPLSTVAQYALAQILCAGAITYGEFQSMNSMLGEVQEDAVAELLKHGYVQYTLLEV